MKKMKSLMLLIATVLMLTVVLCVNASAAEWKALDDNHQYSFDEDTGVMIIRGSDDIVYGSSFGVDCYDHYNSFCSCTDWEFDDYPYYTDEEEATISAVQSTRILIVEEGISKLGASVFTNFENAEIIILPQSITEIPDGAFYNLDKLRTVVLSNSTVSIGKAAFAGCTNLQGLTLPDSVKTIGDTAFFGCDSGLIRIPKSVEKKGKLLFFPEAKVMVSWRKSERMIEAYPYDYGDLKTYSSMFKGCGTEFYSYNKYTGKYTKIAETKEMGAYIPWDQSKNTNIIKFKFETSKVYYFVSRFYRDIGGRRIYSEPSEMYTYVSAPTLNPVNAKTVQVTATSVKLSWEKCTNAHGYRVLYREKGRPWQVAGTTSGLGSTVKNLKPGTTYSFIVCPYVNIEGNIVWGRQDEFLVNTLPETPTAKVSSPSKGKVTVSWQTVAGGKKYQLYYKVGNGSYKLYKTYDGAQNLTFSNLKSGTKYTFAVRAYWTVTTQDIYVNSKPVSTNYYSAYKPVTVTVK